MSKFKSVIERANTDQGFRNRLKADPVSACREAGVDIAEDANVEVIERKRNEMHFLLGSRTDIPVLDKILQRADDSPEFRAQLISDPKTAIQDATGETLPAGCKVHVQEMDPDRIYILLGDSPANDGELSDSEMEGVAGGTPFLAGVLAGTILGGGAAISAIVINQPQGTLKGIKKFPPKQT